MVERLHNGAKLLFDAQKQGSMTKAFEIVQQYQTLAFEMMRRAEEMMLIHQFLATGYKTYIRRNGQQIHFEDFVQGEDLEVDAKTLQLLQGIQQVFGSIPHELLEITDETP